MFIVSGLFIPTHAGIGLSADLTPVKRYINMRKALDISRLTRPARIRCRPFLFLRNRSLSSSVSRSKPLGTPAKASNVKEEQAEKPHLPAFGARRAEMEDYILTMEMAKLEDGYAQPRGMSNRRGIGSSSNHRSSYTVRKIRKSKLPSLHDPQSFLWDSQQVSSSKVASSARTSQPSRKGKEKEVVADGHRASKSDQDVKSLKDAKPINLGESKSGAPFVQMLFFHCSYKNRSTAESCWSTNALPIIPFPTLSWSPFAQAPSSYFRYLKTSSQRQRPFSRRSRRPP